QLQIHHRHGTHGVIVPGVSRRRLVVPDILAGASLHGNDRSQVQVVAVGLVAILIVPGRAVAGTEIDEVGLRVIDDRIPHRAAAPQLPPVAAPGRGGLLHGLVLEAVGGVAGDGVETPGELTRLGVIGTDITADAVLATGLADEDLALGDPRRAGDG